MMFSSGGGSSSGGYRCGVACGPDGHAGPGASGGAARRVRHRRTSQARTLRQVPRCVSLKLGQRPLPPCSPRVALEQSGHGGLQYRTAGREQHSPPPPSPTPVHLLCQHTPPHAAPFCLPTRPPDPLLLPAPRSSSVLTACSTLAGWSWTPAARPARTPRPQTAPPPPCAWPRWRTATCTPAGGNEFLCCVAPRKG